MTFFAPYKTGYIIRIKLTPNAFGNDFGDVVSGADGELYIKAGVTVAPEKGKANKELLNMLCKRLKVSKQAISVIYGLTSHYKKVYIDIEQSEDFTKKLRSLEKRISKV